MERDEAQESLTGSGARADIGTTNGSMQQRALPTRRMPRDALLPEIDQQALERLLLEPEHRPGRDTRRLRELLNYPDFRPSAALGPESLDRYWSRLSTLLQKGGVKVEFLADYALALKYDFIIGELLDEETELPECEGAFVNFIYEDFHPNHDYDIRSRTAEFMDGFFSGRFPLEVGWYLADIMITDTGAAMPRSELQSLLDSFHEPFNTVRSFCYEIESIAAQPEERPNAKLPGLGVSEGWVKADMVCKDGTEQHLSGQFKLYLQCWYGWWELYFFTMPGFSWS